MGLDSVDIRRAVLVNPLSKSIQYSYRAIDSVPLEMIFTVDI
jgi:hypothetical protein